jgi:cell shape-determining protein MreD
MLAVLLAIPVFLVLIMLQTAIVSTLPLLHGTADLVLLVLAAWSLQDRVKVAFEWGGLAGVMVGFISKVGMPVPLIGYLGVAGLAQLLRRQVWQTPILAMFITTLFGSLLLRGMELVQLRIQGVALPLADSINLVILPGTFLNLLLALPIYALVTDFTQSVFPEEVEP